MFNVYVQWRGVAGNVERKLVHQAASLERANAWMGEYDLDDWEGNLHMVVQDDLGRLRLYRGNNLLVDLLPE